MREMSVSNYFKYTIDKIRIFELSFFILLCNLKQNQAVY